MDPKQGWKMETIELVAIVDTYQGSAAAYAELLRSRQIARDSEVRNRRILPNYQATKWPMDLVVPHKGCLC